ncbi:MAG: hypothetical protein LAP87_25880 [Acidobacteriia bacterium]|nr:hypothetical protein [Terriglobia bacterium]
MSWSTAKESGGTGFLSELRQVSHEIPFLRRPWLAGGVRGKYYRRAAAGTSLVLIEPGLADMFPDSKAVNRALRVVAEAKPQVYSNAGARGNLANSVTQINTAASGRIYLDVPSKCQQRT